MNELYINNLEEFANYKLDWEMLRNKTIMISGSTGLIGRYIIDLLMYKNNYDKLNCYVVALGRNKAKADMLFQNYQGDEHFTFYECDVKEPLKYDKDVNYIIHAASNTYPIQYATDPVGTITTNVLGTYNLLEYGYKHNITKFIFVSSFEVYGKVNDIQEIGEHNFGTVDCTVLRSCYPESKRTSESLCVAYSSQKGMNTSIVRLSRVFGPTMNLESSLATASFIKNGLNKEDIVLKSNGEQLYSYNYVGDAVTAILLVMLKGENAEAYNVSNGNFDCKLKEFAKIVADYSKQKVIFDLPSEIEKKGFSNTEMTILNSDKLTELGWYVNKDIKYRLEETLDIMRKNR